MEKTFDYLVPDRLQDQVRVGTLVRVALAGRRVGGWVVALHHEPPPGVDLKPLAKVTGVGPPAELLALARWGAWRWAGRVAPLLVTASPPVAVPALPAPPRRWTAPVSVDPLAAAAVGGEGPTRCVLRLPPGADQLPVVLAACRHGPALVVVPEHDRARVLAARLRRAGVPVALHPRDWASGAAGATVVGTRAAAWAPVGGLGAVVVLDEHDEALKEEQTIAWHARDVAVERARRAGVPAVLVSPAPSLEALEWGPLLTPSRNDERAGWPILDVIDRTTDDPWRRSIVSDALGRHLRSGRRVVCVLNTPGRARLLACAACRVVARCERCRAAVAQRADGRLACGRCGLDRPLVCDACGASRLKVLRPGTARVRDELEAAAQRPVVEVTAARPVDEPVPEATIYVGTEAVLHRVPAADVVVFLDLDAELLAPRYRANEQALALLVRAARLVGGRDRGGRIVVQTSVPRHEVLDAVLHADPGRLAESERQRRASSRMPPAAALAAVSGPAAPTFVEHLGQPGAVEVLGPVDGRWLVRADDHRTLCDALAAVPRPSGRLRVEVDPLRI